ncbi:MAG: hypothetical protein HY508_06325 [Acidobacteria bacterium]|nr:hypothetical protein [Acidobacteriota bacterium]
MKISRHKDTCIFDRHTIVDTRDVGEAMRRYMQYKQVKRLARARRVVDVHSSFTGAEKPALPAPVR